VGKTRERQCLTRLFRPTRVAYVSVQARVCACVSEREPAKDSEKDRDRETTCGQLIITIT